MNNFFSVYAILVQGQYIFTFDGKLVNFPGNCKYLLARDAVNGNFTLVGTYLNGHLNSITLADHHDSVTIKKGGQVQLNNGEFFENRIEHIVKPSNFQLLQNCPHEKPI